MKLIRELTIYENPDPLMVSRQAMFPGVIQLSNDDLLAIFSIGQAFDSADKRAYYSKSYNLGKSWTDPKRLNASQTGSAELSETMKPLLLANGTVLATGYAFVHPDPLTPIVNPKTFKILPLQNLISYSKDSGQTWDKIRSFDIEHAPLEMSGPCIQLASGRILGATTPFHLGSDNQSGWIVFSDDNGQGWGKLSEFFRGPESEVSSWESRICELKSGRLAVLFWAYDNLNGWNLPNKIVYSKNGGVSFGPAVDTGIQAQASNMIWLGGDEILTIHSHREAPVRLVVRRVNISDDGFNVLAEIDLLDSIELVVNTSDIGKQFGSLKFGQPSLLQLNNGQILASFWCVKNNQFVVKGCILEL